MNMRSGNGITRLMQNIRHRPPEWVHRHAHPAGWDRRHERTENGGRRRRKTPLFAGNTPYVNLARDEQRRQNKKGAKLRGELS